MKVLHHSDRIKSAGAAVVVIAFDEPDTVSRWLNDLNLPYPVLLDPERGVYSAYGIGRAPWTAVYLRPGVAWKWVKLLFRWRRQRRFGTMDSLQLGGDFVIDRDGRVVLAHPETDPADREPAGRLVQALKSAAR